ncbi:hypothetical protein R5R35_000049 [Gryllus longicercus]|uniref:Sphingomyelin phosphodiesterase 4 n=1 Tax=Gryllus longicercus TaxID=2509291 RepID=A0AAN9Z1Z3_9ORTH
MNEVMIRLQNIFGLPLCSRCEEIRRLIAECSQKELQSMFPILLENIFGINNQQGWNLCSLSSVIYPTDYEYVLHFLSSQGPMFNLIYRLMSDCYLKYEFSLSLFPPNVKKLFEEDIPQYYLDKIQIDQHTKMVTSLALNPFEYYIFHFASYLVSPFIKSTTSQPTDSVYVSLCEDYLLCFLPCTRSEVLPPVDHQIVKSPVPRPQVVTTPVKTPTIFRQSILSKTNPPASFHSSPNAQTTPHMEVWRTETVIQAFLDLWLTYGCIEVNSFARIRDLPGGDRIRIARLLVKHFHYFANVGESDLTPMGEIRRSLRQVTRLKIYTFLRRTIQDWPLDSSFRGVLETWLSYIQPWRYLNFDKRNRSQAMGVKDPDENFYGVERHMWTTFIVENLFAYTIIFQQLIPRFSRLDLTTPRNAHMLHRVSKVFAQPHLNVLLAEAEACLNEEARWAASRSRGFNSELRGLPETMPELITGSPTIATFGHKWNAVLKQLLQELEGPHYEYTFLFDYASGKIEDLLKMVLEATIAAHILLKYEEKLKRGQTRTFMSKLKEFFCTSLESSEFSIEERKKVVLYLETSLKNFAVFFKVPPPALPDLTEMTLQDVSSLLRPEYSSLYQFTNNNVLGVENQSPRSLQTLRFRKAAITYEGDPDLQPVRSNECAILVHLFFMITSNLNFKFKDEMALLYYRDDIVGKIARQIMWCPLVIRTYDKSAHTRFAQLTENLLPPRLSLRGFASLQFLSYCSVIVLVFWFWGYHPLFLMMCAFLFWALYIFMRALCEPLFVHAERESPPQSLNVSDVSDRDLSVSF